MRILIITPSYPPKIGGVGQVVYYLCNGLIDGGFTVTLITMGSEKFYSEEINGCRVIRTPKSILPYDFNINLFIKMWQLIKKQKSFDIVHIHGFHSLWGFEAAMACKILNIPYIFSPHYHGHGHTKLNRSLFRYYKIFGGLILKKADSIICVSEYESKLIKNDFHILDNINIIPNGVMRITHTPFKINKSNNISLLYVGALRRYKGVEYVIQTLKGIIKLNKNTASLIIIGDGEDKTFFKNQSEELDLTNNIQWFKSVNQDELINHIRASDFLFLLSEAEAFGLVVAESLAEGTPCIVSDMGALSEYSNEPGCFIIRFPPDIDQLVEMVISLKKCNIALMPHSKKIIVWEEVIGKYGTIYSDVIKNSRAFD